MTHQQVQFEKPAQASSRAEVEQQKTGGMKPMKNKVMAWVDVLPGVEATGFQAKRDDIAELMAEAAELTRKAEELRSRAYFAACSLEGEARSRWTLKQIDAAKRTA